MKPSQPTLDKILREHESNLVARIKAVQEEMAALEAELADVQRAKSVVRKSATVESASTSGPSSIPSEAPETNEYESLTLKDLVRLALRERFHDGATASQLLEYFREAYGREVVRTSLSPQLTRLKAAGEIDLHGSVWFRTRPEEVEAPTGSHPEGASNEGEGGSSPMASQTNPFD